MGPVMVRVSCHSTANAAPYRRLGGRPTGTFRTPFQQVRRSLGPVSPEPDLVAISAAIHDDYFDVEAISFNADAKEVRLLIYRGETKKHFIGWSSRPPGEPLSPPVAELVIRGVVGMSVKDDAGIGWVDVQGITYDEAEGESPTCM